MYVIFPTECMTSPSGLMVGTNDEDAKILSVVTVVSLCRAKTLHQELKGKVLGFWVRFDHSILEQIALEEYPKLVLVLPHGKKLPEVYSADSNDVVVILYNRPTPLSYLTTTPLSLRSSVLENGSEVPQSKTHALPLPKITTQSHTEEILNFVNHTTEVDKYFRPLLQTKAKYSLMKSLYGILSYLSIIQRLVLGVLVFISRNLLAFSGSAIFKTRGISFVVSLPVYLIQCSLRLSQITFLGNTTNSKPLLHSTMRYKTKGKKHSEELHEKQRHFIITGNLITSILLDVILGLAVVTSLLSSTIIEDIANNLVEYTGYIAQLLSELIHWMMGVPGGLKLNKTLTNFLGKFFLYHIYLWQTYLQIIQPYLQTVLWICIMSGCLGLTFLITMASDVLSLLTLHIYFVYVYAARLYCLQVYALQSLARLFTGKKWNVLRNRVDSLPYDVDRLFIGTLLFTILLFLLPTTALFYVVFTTLRLLVLVLKFLLSSVTHFLNKLPLFGLALLLIRPKMLPG